MKSIESNIQQACVYWFRLRFPKLRKLLFSVPNGGYRYAATARKIAAEGVVSGVSDLLFLYPSGGYHGLAIEMKTRIGRQSDNQKEWQKAIEAVGYKYEICRSIDEFMNLINSYIDSSNSVK